MFSCLFFTHKYNDFVTELELAGNRLGQDGVRSVCDLLVENPVIRKVVGTVVVGRTISKGCVHITRYRQIVT